MALDLTISTSGTGTGLVTSTFPLGLGISCPAACMAVLPGVPGSIFSLSATADPGSFFVKWTAASTPTINQVVPKTSVHVDEDFIYNNTDSDYSVDAEFQICPVITINPPGPFEYEVNTPFGPVQLVAAGGVSPYTFSIEPDYACFEILCPGATFPLGISIGASTGIISGTPTAEAVCQYIPISVTDANGCKTVVCVEMTVKPIPICYVLFGCDGRPNPIIVTNDLSQYVGNVIQILGECFTVAIAQACTGAITLNNPIITEFADCCSCNPPELYELVDCTLQTPVIITTATVLASYVDKTIKVCDFEATLTLNVFHPNISCTQGTDNVFVTQITGPTSGYVFDDTTSTANVPYVNPSAFPLVVGTSLCLAPANPFVIVGIGIDPTDIIQFFIGTTAITTPISISSSTTATFLQYLITANSLDPTIVITVVTFDLTGLTVNITIAGVTTETTITGTVITPPYMGPVTVTVPITGSCICYTVKSLGTSCNQYPAFDGVISGAFDDCVCCDPPAVEPDPPYIPTPPAIDKHTYRIPESQCDIDANKIFANAMYDQFKTDAYGMESCCPKNMNSIWIQKELSDLNKLNC